MMPSPGKGQSGSPYPAGCPEAPEAAMSHAALVDNVLFWFIFS